MFTFPDAQTLDERHRRELAKLCYAGFVEIRRSRWDGTTEQATAAADALHNLPLFLCSDRFSFSALREALKRYQTDYPPVSDAMDFAAELDRVAAGGSIERIHGA